MKDIDIFFELKESERHACKQHESGFLAFAGIIRVITRGYLKADLGGRASFWMVLGRRNTRRGPFCSDFLFSERMPLTVVLGQLNVVIRWVCYATHCRNRAPGAKRSCC